ncbi:MAG: DUF5615 family PIN-like protein [Acidobacteria bacterium]|nr:DUF5615 family PIN-like protein [Acidobacteriota bacterium]
MDADLVRGLRSRAIDVLTAADAGMIRKKDEDHLSLATVQGRALYSFNVADFHEIHTDWMATGRFHCGIILAQQVSTFRLFAAGTVPPCWIGFTVAACLNSGPLRQ